MTSYIVTVKADRNPDHDPNNKQTGNCNWAPFCTDVTGQHHSFLVSEYNSPEEIQAYQAYLEARGVHVTRIEMVY